MTIIKKIKDYLYHLLNLIKRYINRYRTDNEITVNEGLFNSLMPGDIVWSKMPLDDISLAKVKPGHRVRPYVFLKRKKDSFLDCIVHHWQLSKKKLKLIISGEVTVMV